MSEVIVLCCRLSTSRRAAPLLWDDSRSASGKNQSRAFKLCTLVSKVMATLRNETYEASSAFT